MAKPVKQTTRQREELYDKGIDPDTMQPRDAEQPDSAPGQPARSRERRQPAGYGDDMLWAMAERFEQRAYGRRVYLGGKGAPYIYRAMAQAVNRIGLHGRVYRNGKNQPVKGMELGVRLVDYFWEHAPWDEGGDVISAFADPMMLEDCLHAMARRWRARRAMARISVKPRKAKPFNREDT